MNTGKLALYIGTGILATLYSAGVYTNSKELSDKLEPIRADFKELAKETPRTILKQEGEVRLFDYGGKTKPIIHAKNQYAKDNGAFAVKWDFGHGITPSSSTPGPIAFNPAEWTKYNPFRHNHKINDTAIKNYQKNHSHINYNNRK